MIEDRKNVLEKIIRYLSIKDYIRLGPICSSWSAKARKRHYSLRHCLPYLVTQNRHDDIEMRFFNLSRQVFCGQASYPQVHGRYFCGSSQGWLVTIDFDLKIHLFDPYSSASQMINLPSLPAPQEQHIHAGPGQVLNDPQVRRDWSVYKVILSADPRTNSDYMVVAIFEWLMRLALWKPGASTWVTVDLSISEYGYLSDMLWHKETLYVITDMYFLFTLDRHRHQLILINNYSYANELRKRHVDYRPLRYLVEIEGELHLILRFVPYFVVKTYSLTVLKFNPENKEELTELKSIGDYALFLGRNHSIVVAVPNNNEYCQSDSVYFIDNYVKTCRHFGFEDLGMFNMKDATFQPLILPRNNLIWPEAFRPPLLLEARPYPW